MATEEISFYSDLGVSETASHEEIRAVYRALAKIYHPDVNKDRAASEKFRRITAAYEVLSDPSGRAAYDKKNQPPVQKSEDNETEARRARQVPIVECSVCKKPTAQPRFLVFRQVVSVIFFTRVTPKAGVYCSSCAVKQAMHCSLFSAAFGWWGVPWGPIYTITHVLKNAFGGDSDRGIDEQLMWQNAIAFGRRGNIELAAALASQLVNAKDKTIAEAAKNLKSAIQADGVTVRPFKSAWGFNLGNTFKQIASLAVVPLIIGGFAYGSSGQSSRNNAFSTAPTYKPSNDSAAQQIQPAPKLVLNLCKQRPTNGQLLTQKGKFSENGHTVSIKNGSDGDAIIKIRDKFASHTLFSFFVAKSSTASINGLPDGDYKIQFATGDAMTSNCLGFIEPSASEFGGTDTFATTYTSTQIITQQLDLTLYRVSGGNAQTNKISGADFQKD
jgi:hypothetical protein